MALFYADASALVKLVRDEPESAALRAFLADADVVSLPTKSTAPTCEKARRRPHDSISVEAQGNTEGAPHARPRHVRRVDLGPPGLEQPC